MIVITGTPGTGKSTIAKKLGKRLHVSVIDLNKYIKKNKLYDSFDKKRKTYVFDIEKLGKIAKKFDKDSIVESHMAHFMPKKYANLVVVLKTNPKILEKRLKKRKWNSEKVRENVEAEMIDLISFEANKRHKNVLEITTDKINNKIIDKIVKHLNRKTP